MATTTPPKPKPRSKRPTVKVTLATFATSPDRPIYRQVRNAKLKDFAEVTHEDYAPAGMTPLLDATGLFIKDMRDQSSKDEVQIGLLLDESGSMQTNRDAVIASVNEFVSGLRSVKKVDPNTAGTGFLVIATDGQENYSKEFTKEKVAKLVKKCEKDGWITIFLGASIDGWAGGQSIGISGQSAHAQTISTVSTPAGTTSALRHAGQHVNSYLSNSARYMAEASSMPSRSVVETGEVLVGKNIADPAASSAVFKEPDVATYGNAGAAVKRVADKLSE